MNAWRNPDDGFDENMMKKYLKWVKKHRPKTHNEEKIFYDQAHSILRQIRDKRERFGGFGGWDVQAQNYLQGWENMKTNLFETMRLYYP